jgi:hypothetical protein
MFNLKDRSPAYEAAVEALKRLSPDDAQRACAEAVAPALQKHANAEFGARATGQKSWQRLLGKRGKATDSLPGDDHAELFLGDPLTYVSHPYSLSLETIREIVAAYDEHGLDVTMSGYSSYFRGAG